MRSRGNWKFLIFARIMAAQTVGGLGRFPFSGERGVKEG